jgi:hypothetical protein
VARASAKFPLNGDGFIEFSFGCDGGPASLDQSCRIQIGS